MQQTRLKGLTDQELDEPERVVSVAMELLGRN
jgi:hypothetical protein